MSAQRWKNQTKVSCQCFVVVLSVIKFISEPWHLKALDVQCQQDSSSVINVHIEHVVLLSESVICINNSTHHHLE